MRAADTLHDGPHSRPRASSASTQRPPPPHPSAPHSLLPPTGTELSSSSDDDGGDEPQPDADAPPLPAKGFVLGGHASFLDVPPATPEPLASLEPGLSYLDIIVRAITADAETLVASTAPDEARGAAAGVAARSAMAAGAGSAAAARWPGASASAACAAGPAGFPRQVFDAHPADGTSPHAGALDSSLRFDASFESANLRRAVQTGPTSYTLVLACDVNTRGHTQWFHFRVANAQAGVPYRLSIVNMMKPDSLFALGMRPLLYSEAQGARGQLGWRRCGDNICYFANQYTYVAPAKRRAGGKAGKAGKAGGEGSSRGDGADAANVQPYYTLTMTIRFPEEDDVCYVAQCYPFTHSMLRRYLDQVKPRCRQAYLAAAPCATLSLKRPPRVMCLLCRCARPRARFAPLTDDLAYRRTLRCRHHTGRSHAALAVAAAT